MAAAVIAFFTLPYFIEILFPSFVSSILVVRIMSLAIIPSTIVAIISASLLGRGKSKTVLIAGLIYLISLIIGVIALGGALGALGLALTLVVAQSIQAGVLLGNRKVTT